MLYLAVDAGGNVLEHRIERSSGHRLLDREVKTMLKRAQPLPGAPADVRQARLELLLPIEFEAR